MSFKTKSKKNLSQTLITFTKLKHELKVSYFNEKT